MVAVITGDIIGSELVPAKYWKPLLKRLFNKTGRTPVTWEIYRGDAFQLLIRRPEQALRKAILIKSALRQINGLDIRLSIGLGDISHNAKKVSESQGSAFTRSGRTFDSLKDQGINLAITSGNEEQDYTMNLLIRLALTIMDNWSPVAAETVQCLLENPDKNQNDIAAHLQINQSAVSQRRKRSQYDLISEIIHFYETLIQPEKK